jgi:uncharacterized membrane protein
MNTDAIKQLLQDFSFETFLEDLLPELAPLLEKTALLSRLLMLIGPFIILGMGLYYFLNAPKEANFRSGYRCYFGMGSVEAWRFSQRLAGGIWCLVGLGLAIWMALAGPKLVDMALLDRMGQMAFYIFCQAMALLLSRWIINLLVFLRYDAKGRRRYTWAELWKG